MLHGLTLFEQVSIWSVLGISVLGLLYALFLRRQILREDKGSKEMREVWEAIRAGSDTYLGKQLRTIAPIIFFLTFALFFSVYIGSLAQYGQGLGKA
jgi:K(+)-stimulated pyrophosphate-energized sodium pump